jgi:hypothetical protein
MCWGVAGAQLPHAKLELPSRHGELGTLEVSTELRWGQKGEGGQEGPGDLQLTGQGQRQNPQKDGSIRCPGTDRLGFSILEVSGGDAHEIGLRDRRRAGRESWRLP